MCKTNCKHLLDTKLIFDNSSREELETVLRSIMYLSASTYKYMGENQNTKSHEWSMANSVNMHYIELLLPLISKDPHSKNFIEIMESVILKDKSEDVQ